MGLLAVSCTHAHFPLWEKSWGWKISFATELSHLGRMVMWVKSDCPFALSTASKVFFFFFPCNNVLELLYWKPGLTQWIVVFSRGAWAATKRGWSQLMVHCRVNR